MTITHRSHPSDRANTEHEEMEATWFGKAKCVHKFNVIEKAGLKAAVTIDLASTLDCDNRKRALRQDPIHRRFQFYEDANYLNGESLNQESC